MLAGIACEVSFGRVLGRLCMVLLVFRIFAFAWAVAECCGSYCSAYAENTSCLADIRRQVETVQIGYLEVVLTLTKQN